MTSKEKSDPLKVNGEDNSRPELEFRLSELEILKQSLDEAKGREREVFDQLLRLRAEFENFRKRAETRVADARQYGRQEVLLEVIGVSDILNQAVDSTASTSDVDSLKKGFVLVQQQVQKFLSDHGLVPIPAVGQRLDPHKHEAIAQEEAAGAEDGVIVAEFQRGYELSGRVVRTAKVKVAVAPEDRPANEKPEGPQEEKHV